jgi:hypothetical protein
MEGVCWIFSRLAFTLEANWLSKFDSQYKYSLSKELLARGSLQP